MLHNSTNFVYLVYCCLRALGEFTLGGHSSPPLLVIEVLLGCTGPTAAPSPRHCPSQPLSETRLLRMRTGPCVSASALCLGVEQAFLKLEVQTHVAVGWMTLWNPICRGPPKRYVHVKSQSLIWKKGPCRDSKVKTPEIKRSSWTVSGTRVPSQVSL